MIYAIMYISCLGVKSLHQSVMGQCSCGWMRQVDLLSGCQHDATMHRGPKYPWDT